MRSSTLLPAAGIALGLSLLAAPAAAEYPETAPVRPFNLPDLSGLTSVGLDVQYTTWTVPLPLDTEQQFTSSTFDLVVDVAIAPHWVLVARMPFVYGDVELRPVDNDGCCGFGLGNLTLGVRGLYSRLHGDGLRSVLGGELSLSLATAGDDGDDAGAAVIAAIARRPHDPGRYLPNTWTPRLTGHAQIYSGVFMVQIEAGLHFFLYDDDVPGDDSDIALRLALAAGVRVNAEWAILAELNNMLFADDDDDSDDDTVSSADLGVRYGAENVVVGLRLYLPLDEEARDVDMFGIGIDLGARF